MAHSLLGFLQYRAALAELTDPFAPSPDLSCTFFYLVPSFYHAANSLISNMQVRQLLRQRSPGNAPGPHYNKKIHRHSPSKTG
jgi:hypothetical protein